MNTGQFNYLLFSEYRYRSIHDTYFIRNKKFQLESKDTQENTKYDKHDSINNNIL